MSLARLVITAVTLEGCSKSEVARDYGVSRYWVQQLVKQFEFEGPAAFEPRSRRPHSNPRAVSLELEDQIVRLRKTLTKKGLDASAETIAAHLPTAGVKPVPAVSTSGGSCPGAGSSPATAETASIILASVQPTSLDIIPSVSNTVCMNRDGAPGGMVEQALVDCGGWPTGNAPSDGRTCSPTRMSSTG